MHQKNIYGPSADIKRTIRFALFVDILLIIVSVFGIYQISERATISGAFLKKSDGVYIRKIVSETDDTHLQPYDRIVSIDGNPVHSPTQLEFILDRYKIGDSVDVVIERAGTFIEYTATLTPFYSNSYTLIVIAVGFLYFFVAIVVLVRRPEDRAGRTFHWASVMVAIIITATWGCYAIEPYGTGHLVRIFNTIAYILTPAFFFHFTLLFPKEQHWGRKLLPVLYGIAVALIIYISTAFILGAEPFERIVPQRYVQAYDAGRIFFSACVILSVANIQYKYFKIHDEIGRRKLRWIMLGLSIVPLVFIGLWQLPQTFLDQAWIQEEIVILVSSLVPITFSISIVRYHIFNIDRIFGKTTVYTIVIAIILGLYIFIVGITADFLGKQIAMSNIFAPALAAIIVALIFEPLRRSVQTFVDKTYFRIQYDYREAMQSFADEINDLHDPNEIALYIIKKTESFLPVKCICVLNSDYNGRKIRNACNQPMPEQLLEDDISFDKFNFINGLQLFGCEQDVEPGREYSIMPPEKMPPGISMIVTFPLENADRRWLLLLGARKSETRFSIEDIDLIKSFVNQGAMLIDRLLLQRKLIIEREHAHQLEELNRLKSFFVSSVSHDLKTPLTSIRMFAEMLQAKNKHISGSDKEYLEIIQGESERLGRLIDNVLEFTKIERGLKTYQMTEIRLNALVEKVLNIFKYQFVLQDVILKTSFHRREILLTGDHDALIQVLTNLLSNAIKYSRNKKYLAISTGVTSENGYIRISDKGMGIEQKDVNNIFKPFFRSSHPDAQQLDGAGLGLALVSHIIDAHNGTIDVQSKPDKGSTFTVNLPIKYESASPKRKNKT